MAVDSYLFHRDRSSPEELALLAPPPPEYVAFCQRRAVYEATGYVMPMTVREYVWASVILDAEARHRQRAEPKRGHID